VPYLKIEYLQKDVSSLSEEIKELEEVVGELKIKGTDSP
jgi:hypothetical protein